MTADKVGDDIDVQRGALAEISLVGRRERGFLASVETLCEYDRGVRAGPKCALWMVGLALAYVVARKNKREKKNARRATSFRGAALTSAHTAAATRNDFAYMMTNIVE